MEYAVALKRTSFRHWLRIIGPVISNIVLISTGCAVFAFGMNAILIPYDFLSGGTTGIAMVWHHYSPTINIGWMYMVLNMPLIIFGWRAISLNFALYTVYGIAFFSFIAGFLTPAPIQLDDRLVAALLAGLICGVGGGLILRTPGSAGGLDIVAVYLKKKFGFSVGSLGFIANATSVLASMVVFSVQAGIYTLIFLFTASKVIDYVVYGLNRKKSLLVISNYSDTIAETLLKKRSVGVTFLNGQGGFTKDEKKIIFTIVGRLEMQSIKNTILKIDPRAFIVVNDTHEVLRPNKITSPL
jgi:uncharacterized membrane-anchored protein YitT (DUF2179 family)